jgi:uncharacterized protein DUF2855
MAHHLVLELAGERGVVSGPRDRGDDHAVTLAAHAGRVGLEVGERRPEVQRPPTPAAVAQVISRAASPAVRATIELARGRTDRHHQRAAVGELDVLHDSSVETEELLPYASSAHAVTALSCGSATVRSRNRKSTAACASSSPEVGRSQRPDVIAPKRGRRRLSSSADPAMSSENVSRAATATTALLDQTTTAALPRAAFTSPTEHAGEPFFFAPDRRAKRSEDWGGPAELARRISAAWHPFCEWTRSWLEVIDGHGFEAVQRAYLDVLDGRVDANTAHVLTLD